MAKVWCTLAILFCFLAAGEFFYFDAQLKRWRSAASGWQSNLDAAKRDAADAKLALSECQAKPDSAECARNLAICLKAAPNALNNLADSDTPPTLPDGYQDWPEWLRPDSKGVVQLVKKYYLGTLKDLNAFKIIEYGKPVWDDANKWWAFEVQVRARSQGGEYFIYRDTFHFRKDGAIYDVLTENTLVKP